MFSMLEILIVILTLVTFLFNRGRLSSEDYENLQKELELKNPVHIKIEQIGEIYYAWKDNDFIVQSKDIEEVIKYIKQKFPKNNFLIESNRNLDEWLQTKKD